MRRIRKTPLVVVCIALVVCAAILPGLGGGAIAIIEPEYVVVPDVTVRIIPPPASALAEQLVPLYSPTSSRAPPVAA